MFARKISRPCRLIPYSHTKDFRSRIVSLAPGAQICEHSTRDFEELIIVIEGRLHITDFRKPRNVAAPCAILIPPFTRHNVINKSKRAAKYIYVIRQDAKSIRHNSKSK